MSTPRFVLRDLPGTGAVEALLRDIHAHPNPTWAPGADKLRSMVDQTSRALFGITEEDTYFPDGLFEERDPRRAAAVEEEWRRHFAFLECAFDYEEEAARTESLIWDALGWDVTDGRGQFLSCLVCFQAQMVCATKGLQGHLPGELSDLEAAETAEAWGKCLLGQ